jgi:hypothetical protein
VDHVGTDIEKYVDRRKQETGQYQTVYNINIVDYGQMSSRVSMRMAPGCSNTFLYILLAILLPL